VDPRVIPAAPSVVRPVETCVACPPAPNTIALLVNAAAFVVQVAHAIVPVVVNVPPVIGDVVATLVTVPVPPLPLLFPCELCPDT
jgi:hypothetical protein